MSNALIYFWGGGIVHRNHRISAICDCRDDDREPRNREIRSTMPHCDFRVQWKIVSDCSFELRFLSREPFFLRDSGDLALAILSH